METRGPFNPKVQSIDWSRIHCNKHKTLGRTDERHVLAAYDSQELHCSKLERLGRAKEGCLVSEEIVSSEASLVSLFSLFICSALKLNDKGTAHTAHQTESENKRGSWWFTQRGDTWGEGERDAHRSYDRAPECDEARACCQRTSESAIHGECFIQLGGTGSWQNNVGSEPQNKREKD